MRLSVIFAAALAAPFTFASPAAAQTSTSTWVSRSGNDSNACSYASPCASLLGAYAKTEQSGTIHCLDTGSFGNVGIYKSITIDCKTAQSSTGFSTASILTSDIQVVLRGLTGDGGVDGYSTSYSINIEAAATVLIEDCALRDAKVANPNGHGIRISNSSGTAQVSIRNCSISGNSGSGLKIAPTGSGGAKVTVSGSNLTNNGSGIWLDASGTSGRVDLVLVDTVLDGNTGSGLAVTGGSTPIGVLASRISASNNGSRGVRVANATAQLRLSDSDISGNVVGVEAINGGVIRSFGNNRIFANNGNNGVPPQIVPLQ